MMDNTIDYLSKSNVIVLMLKYDCLKNKYSYCVDAEKNTITLIFTTRYVGNIFSSFTCKV